MTNARLPPVGYPTRSDDADLVYDNNPIIDLTVTAVAAALVARLAAAAPLPGSGLRLCRHADHGSLHMAIAAQPEHADHVLSAPGGALLFLAPETRSRLCGQTLHADLDRLSPAFYLHKT